MEVSEDWARPHLPDYDAAQALSSQHGGEFHSIEQMGADVAAYGPGDGDVKRELHGPGSQAGAWEPEKGLNLRQRGAALISAWALPVTTGSPCWR